MQCWNNIAQEYCLVNVVQIRLRQHCTRDVGSKRIYTFAEKPAVSNMPGSLFLKGYYVDDDMREEPSDVTTSIRK